MRQRIIALVFLLAWGSIAEAQGAKPRLAIKTLDDPSSAPNSSIGTALTEILTTELGRSGKYILVERGAVESILAEIELGAGGKVQKQTAARKGELKGAEYVLLGKVSTFAYRETTQQEEAYVRGVATLRTVYRQQADVRVDFRLVSVESGEVVLAESGTGRQSNVSEVSWTATWNRLMGSSFSVSEMSDSLMGKTTLIAIRDVTRKLADLSSELGSHTSAASVTKTVGQLEGLDGAVLATLPERQCIVGIGRDHGAVKGDRLKVYSEVLTKDKRGQVIYRELQDKGTLLEIVDVSMPDRSKALVLPSAPAGTAIKEGDLVRIDTDFARTLRGQVESNSAAVKPSSGGRDELSRDLADLVRRADRYHEDGHYAQALESYQKAAAIRPDDESVLNKIADTHVRLTDLFEAETAYERLIERGLGASIHVIHAHSFGYCEGELRIEKARVSFTPTRGDDAFTITPQSLVAIEPGSTNANAAGFRLTGGAVAFVLQNASGDRKRYTVFSNAYSSGDSSTGKQRLDDTFKVSRLIERLAQKSLGR